MCLPTHAESNPQPQFRSEVIETGSCGPLGTKSITFTSDPGHWSKEGTSMHEITKETCIRPQETDPRKKNAQLDHRRNVLSCAGPYEEHLQLGDLHLQLGALESAILTVSQRG
jgi:hypothetical protein